MSKNSKNNRNKSCVKNQASSNDYFSDNFLINVRIFNLFINIIDNTSLYISV